MHVYVIENTEARDVAVFAESFEEAAGIYCTWFRARTRKNPDTFSIRQGMRGQYGLKRQHLERAIHERVVGVGRYDPQEGWTVSSPIEVRYT